MIISLQSTDISSHVNGKNFYFVPLRSRRLYPKHSGSPEKQTPSQFVNWWFIISSTLWQFHESSHYQHYFVTIFVRLQLGKRQTLEYLQGAPALRRRGWHTARSSRRGRTRGSWSGTQAWAFSSWEEVRGIVQKLTFSTNSRIDNILLQPVLTLCATWPLCWLEDLYQFKIEYFLIQNYMRTPVSI